MSDLFQFLKKMNAGDFESVNQMSDEEVKQLSPYVLMMWCNGASSQKVEHTILTDTYCNDKIFTLSKHPKLLLKLFTAANCDLGQTRYSFMKSTPAEQPAVVGLVANHYRCTSDEAKDYIRILSKEDLKELKELYE